MCHSEVFSQTFCKYCLLTYIVLETLIASVRTLGDKDRNLSETLLRGFTGQLLQEILYVRKAWEAWSPQGWMQALGPQFLALGGNWSLPLSQ